MNERIQRFILTSDYSDCAPKALYWPTFSLACSMSSSGSDGNIAVIHLCFPLLVRHKKGQLEQRLLIHPVWTEADSLMDEVLLTRCVTWAGSGVWAAGLHTAAGGRWSLRCPAASDWDPSLSALLSWHVQTPWTSMYCKKRCNFIINIISR